MITNYFRLLIWKEQVTDTTAALPYRAYTLASPTCVYTLWYIQKRWQLQRFSIEDPKRAYIGDNTVEISSDTALQMVQSDSWAFVYNIWYTALDDDYSQNMTPRDQWGQPIYDEMELE